MEDLLRATSSLILSYKHETDQLQSICKAMLTPNWQKLFLASGVSWALDAWQALDVNCDSEEK